MKWLIIAGIALMASGCVYNTTEVIQYQQVAVMPVVPVVQPVMLDAYYPDPLDVTTTTIDFY